VHHDIMYSVWLFPGCPLLCIISGVRVNSVCWNIISEHHVVWWVKIKNQENTLHEFCSQQYYSNISLFVLFVLHSVQSHISLKTLCKWRMFVLRIITTTTTFMLVSFLLSIIWLLTTNYWLQWQKLPACCEWNLNSWWYAEICDNIT
jgi:hypothetical protein